MTGLESDRASDRDAGASEVEESISELFRARQSWGKRQAERFQPALAPVSYNILRYIGLHGPLRSADIVTVFGMDKGAVSRQVALLRDAGLIDSTVDPLDGRSSVLRLSATAAVSIEAFTTRIHQQYADVLSDWTEQDMRDLARLLRRLTGDLDERFRSPR